MAEDIKVKPTPIQRNEYDVAVDLTALYYERTTPESSDEVAETFLKFYATIKGAHNSSIYPVDLIEYMPQSLQQIINKKQGK